MSDSFTQTSTKSWFERLKDSITSVLLGVVLFIVAFPILWWNEGRAVQTAKSLSEGAAAVASVPADTVDTANENKLVHTTGTATTDETLTDAEFGISENAIKLIRQVEMYQWQEVARTERERQTGGSEKTTTTYTYNTDWFARVIDSSGFKKPEGHQNPSSMPFAPNTLTAKQVALGAFKLSASQTGRLSQTEPLTITEELRGQVSEAIRSQLQIREGAFYRSVHALEHPQVAKPETPAPAVTLPATEASPESATPVAETPASDGPASSADSGESPDAGSSGEAGEPAAIGEAGGVEAATAAAEPATPAEAKTEYSSSPQVGDVRISFSVVKPMTISLIAQQTGDTFRPYQAKAGDALDLLVMGNQSAEQMFQAAVASSNRLTWFLRLAGLALMLIGVMMVFGPLSVVADVLPILGDLARGGIFFLALAISLPLSLMTIAVAWLAYRPVLGIALIVVAVAAGIGISVVFRKQKSPKGADI